MIAACAGGKPKFKPKGTRLVPATGWRGRPKRERVDGWDTVEFSVAGRLEAQTVQKRATYNLAVRGREGAALLLRSVLRWAQCSGRAAAASLLRCSRASNGSRGATLTKRRFPLPATAHLRGLSRSTSSRRGAPSRTT